MKRTKRGFTIVELVIVIAIIAILAAILVPTFSTVIENAKETSRASEIKSCYTEYVNKNAEKTEVTINGIDDYIYSKNGTTFYAKDGKVTNETADGAAIDTNNGWSIYNIK